MKTLLALALLLLNSPALIAAQSPTATDSGIRDSIKKKVDEELNLIKQAISKRAYLGTISSKSDATLTLTTTGNATRTITVTTDSIIKLTGGKDGTIADLKEGTTVLAMGDADAEGKLTAKRLLVVPTPRADKRRAIFTNITKVTTSQLTVTDNKNQTLTIKLTSATKYTGQILPAGRQAKASDVKVNSKIVVVGTESATANTLTARLIHLVQSP
ncbi:hypothetical protein A2634_01530 [Candidatus Amesbacteria bacterium RIFCSPHIGHO2_01_FULL_48_32]|uniref:DUF5666 domain-containing protein n=1 Tax=Candidatus Amesbacteria bacterium RIFCSPLOWO2_01_FULL_48_25 TaxID=1797259 RepID=A0A1F4ZBR9_9BACT|nr:MAG: hypothetical protein A2634_01530 [Candidatus Amesbacteria bacterium RIFCSPHIGHO2_01_FULL_48_32]OGD03723.1 MAG: hypothetical protein A2989_03515 [Candidatus Amesbacteria bacterium RIFCSPLOWO2_01_FULL_48_25]HJZ05929.1 DUF5666 domain-containing protein [Patescibacteria group bacterium]